ncbi:RNA-guided endonuclease TnpB family protein [Phytomonospora sp. NPDC050363]|uniref:RNA-guided endonuclease InsQ/TnpB family protein n=1 Tax=Phytomonospora sp. NPDC050363 TaxID=3155642 RepID=UPI00340999EC
MRGAYKCRAYPDPEQAAILVRTFGCVRKVWNEVLEWRTRRYRADQVKTSYAESDRYLTSLKKTSELAYLNEVSSVPLQQTLRHQYRAYIAFFTGRSRYPRFKSRNGRQAASYIRSAFRMREGVLHLAKMSSPLPFVWSWPEIDPADIDPATVTVSRDPDGLWFVTFQLDTAGPAPLPETGRQAGLDLAAGAFAVTSDGERFACPRGLTRRERNLARYQRRMARCRAGSNNRAKARLKADRARGKLRRARTDFLQRTSTDLVRRYDLLVVEDLAVTGPRPNRRYAKRPPDTGWPAFRSMLVYKAAKWGRQLVTIDRFFPSSRTCSGCGHLLARLADKTRHWTCPTCRTLHDRDVNAAKNILAEGRSVAACGADIRRRGTPLPRSAAKQETPPVRVRTLH